MDLEELRAAMEVGEQVVLHTSLEVRLTYGLVYEEMSATNVVGYIPGLDRESRGETIKSTFIGTNSASIVNAELGRNEAQVTVRFVSEIVSATYDSDGDLIDGDPEQMAEVTDIWTFARDVKSRDPNWKLVATESEN